MRRKKNHKKLLPVHHTGRIRHHRHTSYGSLALVLFLTCLSLVAVSRSVVLASADPVSANETVYAVVAGSAPATAPVITGIPSGTVYTDGNPVTISGSCPADTLLKVFKNEVFSGAAFCQNGHFAIPIDLFLGSNALIVRAYNANNIMGPESAPIVVQKKIAGIDISNDNQQFYITSSILFKGVNVGDTLSWPITIVGGQAPYALNVAWGDGKTDLISRATIGIFDIKHVYQNPGDGYRGSYDVTITATDAEGNTSFIHLTSIVGGQKAGVVGTVKRGYNLSGMFRIAWQLLAACVLAVLAFWLGERREIRVMRGNLRRV